MQQKGRSGKKHQNTKPQSQPTKRQERKSGRQRRTRMARPATEPSGGHRSMYRKGQDPNQTRGGEWGERASVGLLSRISSWSIMQKYEAYRSASPMGSPMGSPVVLINSSSSPLSRHPSLPLRPRREAKRVNNTSDSRVGERCDEFSIRHAHQRPPPAAHPLRFAGGEFSSAKLRSGSRCTPWRTSWVR